MSAASQTLSAGEAIISRVAANGIKTIFGIPGAQIYPLFDGMDSFGLEVIAPRHEQAAAYMAMGYAKSTGRVGACSVVPGPGVLNTSAALCTAMGNCSAVVCLTGEVPSAYRGRGRGHLHELPDQAATLRSFIKNSFHISDFKEIIWKVDDAFQTARSHRPGPVSVQMCWDQMAVGQPFDCTGAPPPVVKPEVDLDGIDRAAGLIAAASKPMIMCGAGAQHAAEEVRRLAELLVAPVTAFRSGRGVLAEDHPLAAPPVTARELWDEIDLLIGIGSRLEMPYMRWRNPMRYEPKPSGPKLVRLDIDPREMSRLEPDVGIVADSADACRALYAALERRGRRGDAARTQEIAAARARALALLQRAQPQVEYLRVIRSILPRDGFIVPELSQVGFTTYTDALPIYAPRTYVTEGHQGTLGFGFPTALGVKVANPGRAVLSITGDGGFMFGVQELATATQYGIGTVIVLFNNRSYANVLRDQEQGSGRVVASTFENPDFLKLAEAFDCSARRVKSPAELGKALEAALSSDRPELIEVQVERGSEASPWPFIHMTERPSVALARP